MGEKRRTDHRSKRSHSRRMRPSAWRAAAAAAATRGREDARHFATAEAVRRRRLGDAGEMWGRCEGDVGEM